MPDYAPPIARTTDFHFNSGVSYCQKFIIGVSLFCALAAQAWADAATSGGGTAANAALAEVPLSPWTSIVGDPDSKLTVEDILHILDTPGVSPGEIRNSVFGDVSYWFSVPIENSGAVPLQRLLVFDPVWLEDVRVTLLASDGTRQEFKGGWRMPFAQRAILTRKTNLKLTLPPGKSRLVVRVQTRQPWFGVGKTSPLLVSMTLWERSAFFEAENSESAYFAAVYAALGALLVFNLILFFSTRDKIYRAYVVYLGVFLVMHAGYNGHMLRFVWPNSPEWNPWSVSISAYLFVLAGLAFAVDFLDVRAKLPDAWRWTKLLALAVLVSFVATAPGDFGMHMVGGEFWIVIYTLFTLFLGFSSLRNGNRAARYFLSASAAGLVGTLFTDATVSGLIPFSLYGYRAIDIGMLLDASLLSLALAERIRIARMETALAEIKLSEAANLYAQQLEHEVAERTRELDAAQKRLRINEARLQTILDNSPLGIWLVGVDGRYHFVNKTFCNAVGIPEQAFLSARYLSDIMDPEAAANCVRSDGECLAQDAPHLSHETLTFVDGKPHILEITKVKVRDASGEVIGLIGTAIDITEQRERETELAASRERLRAIEQREMLAQERQRLMQDMHDGLGSSLTGALRVVERGQLGREEVAEVIKGCIDDLKLAIDSMEPVEADLLLLLATLRFRLGPRLESTGIALRWEVQDVPPLDWLEPKNALHILRILQEAFTNIIKHTQATEIRVSTRAESNHVVVCIADNGEGFSVADALRKGGKGLSNQQRRAQIIGAEVSWESSKTGTCFTLRLPIKGWTHA